MGSAASVSTSVDTGSSFSTYGVQVQYVREFIRLCGGREVLLGLTTEQVTKKFVVPFTEEWKCSFCNYLKAIDSPAVGSATVFISHAWNCEFLSLVENIQLHFKDAPETFVWIDIFSNNQHKIPSQKYSWWNIKFYNIVKSFGSTLLVFDSWARQIPLTRAWCLYELWITSDAGNAFDVAMSAEDRKIMQEFILSDPRVFLETLLERIDLENADIFNAESLDHLLSLIDGKVDSAQLNSAVFDLLRVWIVEDIKKQMNDSSLKTDTKVGFRNALAEVYKGEGKYEDAEMVYHESLELRRNGLGDEHPETLSSLHDLASIYWYQGKYEECEPLLTQCIDKRKSLIGETHADTLKSLNLLATLYYSQFRFDDAEPLLVTCLSEYRKSIGTDHPETLKCINNLASLYFKQKQYEKAEPLYLESLDMKRASLGVNHPSTLLSLNNMAVLYKSLRKFDLAESYYVSCLDSQIAVLGESHLDTLSTINNLAVFYDLIGEYEKAEALYLQCIHERRLVLGETHPSTLATLNNLAVLYNNQGKCDKAEALFAECTKQASLILGDHHPNTIACSKNYQRLSNREADTYE